MRNPDRPTVQTLLAHAEFVRGLARTLVTDPATADDAVQQAWLAACESPPADARSPRGWLAAVTHNAVRKIKRGDGRRDAREQAAARPEGSVPSAAAIAEREEARRKLVDAVLGLDEPYRSAIVLRFLEELPPREVAARLGVPVETARTRIKRGLEQLRGVLDSTFAGRTAWGLALIPLATTGGGAQAAAGAGAGLGVAAAATLLIGSAVALGFVLSGGPNDDGALGSDGIAQAPAGGEAKAAGTANAPAPLPGAAVAPPEQADDDAPSDALKHALDMVANLKANQADAAKRNAEAAAAPVAAGGGALRLRATAAESFVPFEGTLQLTAHFENAGGAPVKFFTPRFAEIDSFPEWRLHHDDGRVFAPAPWVGQSMWQEGLAGTLHDIAPGTAWTRALSVTRVVAVQADGSSDWKSAMPMPAGRYRITCHHTQRDTTLPHHRPRFRTEWVAVEGVWHGHLEASELWIQVGEPTEPRLAVRPLGAPRAGAPCLVEITVRNPGRAPLPLDGGLTLTLRGKAQRTGVAAVPAGRWRPADGAPLPDPLEVPAAASLKVRVDLAQLAWTMSRRDDAGPAEIRALYEFMPNGTGYLEAAWVSGSGESARTVGGDQGWITIRERAAGGPGGLTCRVAARGGAAIRITVTNDGTKPQRVCTRLSWPRELKLAIADAAAPGRTHASVTGSASGEGGNDFPNFDFDRIAAALSWNGDAYERPAPLTAADFTVLQPGASFERDLDLAGCVYGGLPAGTYRVHAVWRALVTGEHLGLPPAVTALLRSAPVAITVE